MAAPTALIPQPGKVEEAATLRPAAALRPWIASLLLVLPAAIPYTVHALIRKPYSLPTGYIQYDMPIYMAKAREYFDAGRPRVSYSNPCSDSYAGPRLYFQPWTWALGLVHHYSGQAPGTVLVGFWGLAALVCARAALALYCEVVGLDTKAEQLGLVLFFWGGGLIAWAGVVWAWFAKGTVGPRDVFALEPFDGWWFLNFGRNLVYPTEAFYHAVFFLCLLAAMRGKCMTAVLLALLLAASTPFTGGELLAVVGAWCLLEVFMPADRRGKGRLLAAIGALSALFLGYYAGFLERFPEHWLIAKQMSLDWSYPPWTFLLANGLVAPLALGAWWRQGGAFFASPRHRLLIAWFLVSAVLANHGYILPHPRQPIHFDRGYPWAALFLLGARVLVDLFEAMARRPRPWGALGAAMIVAVFLMDNGLWLAGFLRALRSPLLSRSLDYNGVRLTRDQAEVLRRLDDHSFAGALLLSEDFTIGYLAIAETPLRSWVAHPLETPHYRERRRQVEALFREGCFLQAWEARPLLIVIERGPGQETKDPPPWLGGRGAERIFENRKYQIYRVGSDSSSPIGKPDPGAQDS
ncbi:MAG: hypothetical protein IRY99_08600 [Isosphaeraceae bacterium]|nr:hypothetical protein [Isosphaeraceae bacterium]